jgi:hypothetical protein
MARPPPTIASDTMAAVSNVPIFMIFLAFSGEIGRPAT